MSTAVRAPDPGPREGAGDAHAEPVSRGRAAAAEVVGTFFLVYAGTATATAAALDRSIAGVSPDSLAVALAFGSP